MIEQFKKLFDYFFIKIRQDYKSAILSMLFIFLAAVFWVFYYTDSGWQKRYDNQTGKYDSLAESFSKMKIEYQVRLDTCIEQRSTFQLNLYYENKHELEKLRKQLYKLKNR